MLRFEKILFPVDFSQRCVGASQYVRTLARRYASHITLLHVLELPTGHSGDPQFGGLALGFPPVEAELRARDSVAVFLRNELEGLPVERTLLNGHPAELILDVASKGDFGLIVLPTHGYAGFRKLLFGSVASSVLHHSSVPVLTGAHMAGVSSGEYKVRRILFPVNLMSHSTEVLDSASQVANDFGAELTLLHVVPGTEAMPEKLMDCELRRHLMNHAREQLQALASAMQIKASIRVDSGSVSERIEAIALAYEADLVVIGRNGADHHWFGRESYSIARKAPCPVLSV